MKLIQQRVFCEGSNSGCGRMFVNWAGENELCTKEVGGCGRIVTPALWKCDCGEEMECPDFTNTCDKCGADYNSGGQQLAPRSQWGEETGESVADILSVDYE